MWGWGWRVPSPLIISPTLTVLYKQTALCSRKHKGRDIKEETGMAW